jgi:DNA-directed RNA polymerase subunit RPC12/RpoP
MKCPDCGEDIEIEDWMDDEPFGCPYCGIILRLITNKDAYSDANDKRLVLCE